MKKKVLKVFGIIQIIAALVTLGAILVWSPVCSGMLTLESGAQIHMKCYYTGQTAKVLCLIMLFTAVMSLFASKDYSKFQFLIVVIGILMLLLPTSFIIGVCVKEGMACISTAAWIRGSAIVGIITGVLGIIYCRPERLQVKGL